MQIRVAEVDFLNRCEKIHDLSFFSFDYKRYKFFKFYYATPEKSEYPLILLHYDVNQQI